MISGINIVLEIICFGIIIVISEIDMDNFVVFVFRITMDYNTN